MTITEANREALGPPPGLTFVLILNIASRVIDAVVDSVCADIERLLSPHDIGIAERLAVPSLTSLETACSSK